MKRRRHETRPAQRSSDGSILALAIRAAPDLLREFGDGPEGRGTQRQVSISGY